MTARTAFRILGCGASPGVPRIGGDWGACDPADRRNRRRRSSLLVTRYGPDGATRVLVDTSPDLREQALDAGLEWVDAVLYTHAHADHVHGIDDLRAFALNRRARVDVYCDATTSERLRAGFDYCFRTPPGSSYPPILREHRLRAGEIVSLPGPGGAVEALPIEVEHGDIPALGFRIGPVGYVPDVSHFPAAACEALAGLEVLIIDALRDRPHPSHISVVQALRWIDRLRPARAILTHMHGDLDFATLEARLPQGVEPAFDGLTVWATT